MPVKFWTVNELVIIVWNRMQQETDPQVKHHLEAAYRNLVAAHHITDPELYGRSNRETMLDMLDVAEKVINGEI